MFTNVSPYVLSSSTCRLELHRLFRSALCPLPKAKLSSMGEVLSHSVGWMDGWMDDAMFDVPGPELST